MAAHAVHMPTRKRRRWPLRLLGFLATVAFLGSGALIAYMVMPEKEQVAEAPAPQTGAAVKGEVKAKPALTKAQRRARGEAVAKLEAEGYDVVRLADWKPKAAMKVLVGRSDTEAMRAFFFADGAFIGYDATSTSNKVRVVKANGDGVTLAYKLNDGTTSKVRFELQGDKPVALDAVPLTVQR
jgi:LppP/LprE lipoprotein